MIIIKEENLSKDPAIRQQQITNNLLCILIHCVTQITKQSTSECCEADRMLTLSLKEK